MRHTPDIDAITDLLTTGVRSNAYPGAVWAIGDPDGIHAQGAVGFLTPDHPDQPMRHDTVFDIASLTKITAVWTVLGTLVDEGRLDLHAPLGDTWDEVSGHPIGAVTAHQLLTHTAGMPLRANLRNLYGTDPATVRAGVLHEALHRPPGEAVEYTDRAALVLGYLIEHLTDQPLDKAATQRIWAPLGMNETRFGPLPAHLTTRTAPTELDQDTGTHLKGTAHDFSARLLNGVCGIAGAFSTTDDLARLLRHTLAPTPGTAFSASWVKESLRVHTRDLAPARGLFWHPAPGTTPADDIWVHYGFTGTATWIAPTQQRWATLLTNKLHLTREREPLTTIRNTFRSRWADTLANTR
ncbi:serine hydrolase domain-containing protein (plasmid) [Streptomyces sp. BI20]|uniref:serine hydrolase domain-containing protein n=1 Tax=Streptomyces sp. BI20 TaxID=3403460 RepID=UPI003C722714